MYSLTETKTVINETSYTVYGIACGEYRIDDLSADKKSVEDFVKRLNRYELDPLHMFDAAEDFLAELYAFY